MRIAIPIWCGRISPVFDVAGNLLLVDVGEGGELRRKEVSLSETEFSSRVRRIAELEANVLICGAISQPMEASLNAAGVRVIGDTCGPVEEVLRAFLLRRLSDGTFSMPGCCGRRRRFRGGGPSLGHRGKIGRN
ncbi:MAG: NifB/NifX family molybdenum-iron cluster-binding protein [Candidatus Omnitrophica bacterium]|nr:NifB/NifX family molybdenum-iron cluster-binding protein [Candidatus Omnitrophota bacterium]